MGPFGETITTELVNYCGAHTAIRLKFAPAEGGGLCQLPCGPGVVRRPGSDRRSEKWPGIAPAHLPESYTGVSSR